jgi:hypothetical protein
MAYAHFRRVVGLAVINCRMTGLLYVLPSGLHPGTPLLNGRGPACSGSLCSFSSSTPNGPCGLHVLGVISRRHRQAPKHLDCIGIATADQTDIKQHKVYLNMRAQGKHAYMSVVALRWLQNPSIEPT